MERTSSEGRKYINASLAIVLITSNLLMKLSIEAKVVAAVAIAFAALSIGAIAQEQSEHGTGGYAATSNQLSLQKSGNTFSRYNEGSVGRLLAQY